jgi:hypothetical protein
VSVSRTKFVNFAIASHCAAIAYLREGSVDGQRETFSVALDQSVFNAYSVVASMAWPKFGLERVTRRRVEFNDSNEITMVSRFTVMAYRAT